MSAPFILIHISDPHFHRLPRAPAQWLGKRGLGAANLLLRRRRMFPRKQARALMGQLQAMDWQHLLITGDLTQLGLEEEFEFARNMLQPLLERGAERVSILPGNHDRYVPAKPGENGFNAVFGAFFGAGEIHTRALAPPWRLCGWDSALPRPPLVASGLVQQTTFAATEAWLKQGAEQDRVLLANHYPVLFPEHTPARSGHELENLAQTRDWILRHPVDLYLHGHIHQSWILEARGQHRTLRAVNSAASTQAPRPGNTPGFHRLTFQGESCQIEFVPTLLE